MPKPPLLVPQQADSLAVSKIAYRQHAINAMALLYDCLATDHERAAAMELFLQFTWRAWSWNVEKFYSEFKAAQNGTAS